MLYAGNLQAGGNFKLPASVEHCLSLDREMLRALCSVLGAWCFVLACLRALFVCVLHARVFLIVRVVCRVLSCVRVYLCSMFFILFVKLFFVCCFNLFARCKWRMEESQRR